MEIPKTPVCVHVWYEFPPGNWNIRVVGFWAKKHAEEYVRRVFKSGLTVRNGNRKLYIPAHRIIGATLSPNTDLKGVWRCENCGFEVSPEKYTQTFCPKCTPAGWLQWIGADDGQD